MIEKHFRFIFSPKINGSYESSFGTFGHMTILE